MFKFAKIFSKILDFSEPECDEIILTLYFLSAAKNNNKNHHSDAEKQKPCKSMLRIINFENIRQREKEIFGGLMIKCMHKIRSRIIAHVLRFTCQASVDVSSMD